MNATKDANESPTDAKFSDVWKNIQSKYGAKPEKPREIKKQLGKDDFLRIMITQMKHQDPTSPFKAEQFATEMAQFTSVEQLQNMNQQLAKMTTQNQPLERLAMTNLIGKTITVDRERFPHTEGANSQLSFNLPKEAVQTAVSIISEAGEVVWQQDLGALKQGDNSVSWDGIQANTIPAKSGTYMFRVNASDEKGNAIPITTKGQARVVGVSFEAGGEPVLLVGNPASPDKVTMRNVVRIEDQGSVIPGAQSLAAAAGGQQAASTSGIVPLPATASAPSVHSSNFIAFQKGVGSSNLDTNNLPPDARKAVEKFQQQQAQFVEEQAAQARAKAEASGAPTNVAAAQSAGNSSEEKGFPSGFSPGQQE